MERRRFIKTVGAGSVGVGIAGCLSQDEDSESGPAESSDETDATVDTEFEGTLRVGTYESMVDGDNPAGPWIKTAFEERYPEVELEWATPEGAINHYIQQSQFDDPIEADLYLGLNVDDLVRVDDSLDEQLFETLERDRVEHVDRLNEGPAYEFGDPDDRVLPYDTGYISLVYDETVVDEPATFDTLLEPAYEGTLLAQDPPTSDPGQAFLLWTIAVFGEDTYLEFWRDLFDNDVRTLGSWWDSYSAYLEEERPMVVSYSTDQVFAVADERDLSRHQIGFLNDQGYANPEGMGIFEGSDQTGLAYAFMDFVLSSEAQAEIATRNVQFPAVADEHVDLDDSFTDYAFEPPEAVSLTYDQLSGNLDGWLDDWGREFASR